ncbi:MAG: MbtH family NRPS accessory protein [Candidatus Parabeggiatoa sp.]|nr:MbtH family NRPS accessory protein [Candidatus Parabeggiatoa sp.]
MKKKLTITRMRDYSETLVHFVVINNEGQYALWREECEYALPSGWLEVGMRGSKAECREYVNKLWTNPVPLSLRKGMPRQRQCLVNSEQ